MLHRCPECRKKISESAEACPNCGFSFKPENLEAYKKKLEERRLQNEATLNLGRNFYGGLTRSKLDNKPCIKKWAIHCPFFILLMIILLLTYHKFSDIHH